ncbi:MAG: peptidoglycan recognition family protein [Phormidesmis sp.]
MRRPLSVWVISIAIFFLTAALIVSSGFAQEPLEHLKKAVGLPQVEETNPDGALSPAELGSGNTDFILTSPAGSLAQAMPRSSGYQPREEVALADPSNYGERYSQDADGNPLNNQYIVVLHETVGSARSAINLFQVNHPRDEDQVSYHTLIAADGTVIYVVPPEQRAFGAGNSAFLTANGEEAVATNPDFPSSVNNFAYHISLETPPDGRNNGATTHSGYTEAQYQSLGWLIARSSIPNDRITTHRMVDRSGSRIDPRSFEADRLFEVLRQYRG